MKILIVNVVCGIYSTGKICAEQAEKYSRQGHEVRIAYGRGNVPEKYEMYSFRIGNKYDVFFHCLRSRLLDGAGFGSLESTKAFIKWADSYDPDLLWLHNIHGYYINIEELFAWIKKRPDMKVRWTLHDCWAFTGHCAYFSYSGCEKWKKQCFCCPSKCQYPKSWWADNCKSNFLRKKAAFLGVKNMELITPSKWLASLVNQSFLKDYPVTIQYNAVDKSVFKPTDSRFNMIHGIEDKIVILGVASVWEKRKGLEDLYELAKMLDDRFVVVIVGLNKHQVKELSRYVGGYKMVSVNKKEFIFRKKSKTIQELPLDEIGRYEEVFRNEKGIVVKAAPKNIWWAVTEGKSEGGGCHEIIVIPRMYSGEELAAIYSAADWFVNTTHEEVLSMVNLEAIACGTRVVTYDTGGAPETLLI